ncbi:hypothetical protein ACFLVJ_01085 [Chloroflexota bacterium]
MTTLMPGDVISLGTNHQQLDALQNDDKIEMEIGDWGRLILFVQDKLKRA